jgi:hypothetical protein
MAGDESGFYEHLILRISDLTGIAAYDILKKGNKTMNPGKVFRMTDSIPTICC